jgi:hypothetical protein
MFTLFGYECKRLLAVALGNKSAGMGLLRYAQKGQEILDTWSTVGLEIVSPQTTFATFSG